MICKNCGAEISDDAKFCLGCGTPVAAPYAPPVPNVPLTPPAPTVILREPAPQGEEALPEQYRPLGAWAYFGLQLLFCVPIVGFIFLIIFSCNSSNINRRNFARSYWCSLLIVAVIVLVIALLFVLGIVGGSFFAMSR